jgi:terminase large subunit-like protein
MGFIEKDTTSYDVYLGIDIGQAHDPTAIVISDPEKRDGELHYLIRFLQRLPLGISYNEIIGEIKKAYSRIPEPGEKVELNKQLWIDATGVGKPIADLIRKEIPGVQLHEVYMMGGEAKENIDASLREIKLPKAYLISRLQVLLSYGRVHLPQTREALALKEELMNYTIRVNENANTEFGAFKVGTHDDLVTALGLACLCAMVDKPIIVATAGPSEAVRILKGY